MSICLRFFERCVLVYLVYIPVLPCTEAECKSKPQAAGRIAAIKPGASPCVTTPTIDSKPPRLSPSYLPINGPRGHPRKR